MPGKNGALAVANCRSTDKGFVRVADVGVGAAGLGATGGGMALVQDANK
jgi:hypothetical protein